MPHLSHTEETLIEKIRALSPDKAAEVEDFVDFLRRRDDQRSLSTPAMKLSETAFQRIWDNPDDAAYDQL